MTLTIKNATPTQIAQNLSIEQIEVLLQKACMGATFCTKKERPEKEAILLKIKEALEIAKSIK
jgi:hypothetical protein